MNPDYEPAEFGAGSFHAVAPPGNIDLLSAEAHKISIEKTKYLGDVQFSSSPKSSWSLCCVKFNSARVSKDCKYCCWCMYFTRTLTELDLRDCEADDVTGNWLSHFPDSFTSFESLDISSLSSEVSFSALEWLVARSPNLRKLRLNRAAPLDKLATLLRRAPKLVEFGTGSLH